MTTDTIREAMTPGTVTTLGALRPGDVGAFIPESEWFVVQEAWPSGKVVVQYGDDHGAAPYLPTRKVRYLGRGRIEPPRIVMEGEGDRIRELEEQVRMLREALKWMISEESDWENGEVGVGHKFRAKARAALAATAPKGEP